MTQQITERKREPEGHTMNRAAIVTGGNAGIGRSIVEHLLEAGYDVISLDRRGGAPGHPRLHAVEVDLTDAAATREAAAEVCARYAPTTLIHNAGVIRPALLPDVTHEDLIALTNLHLAASVTLAQAMLPAMKTARFGRLVLVSSRAALGLATRTAYSATKAGMLGLVRTWALELGPIGVTANAIAPALIETEMVMNNPRASAELIPMGHFGSVEDVASVAVMLAMNDYITGQTIYVNGGWYMT